MTDRTAARPAARVRKVGVDLHDTDLSRPLVDAIERGPVATHTP